MFEELSVGDVSVICLIIKSKFTNSNVYEKWQALVNRELSWFRALVSLTYDQRWGNWSADSREGALSFK
jgi:hypothetical protein